MFTKMSEYAIKALVLVAHQNESSDYVSVEAIASGINAPKPFVAKILQDLSRKNFITSVRGPKGGYYLTVKQSNRPIIDIIIAIEGDKFLNNCVLGLEQCSNINPCPMHFEYQIIKQNVKNMLSNNTIIDFNKSIKSNKAVLK